ncbi:unnamed protein product [Psylliodes chrysocephalus]|uniref:HAT C-terminal dimerisation domain-containing protein n=1 Tax=Psylliodes chrysocephalus TaxID=3402493 RepID=A0A9P0CQD2_9CUCU|nr:unnamed protein product [Psylliodes chrysocephala]
MCFFLCKFRQNLKKLNEEEGLVKSNVFKEKMLEFYRTCVQYLDEWEDHFEGIERFNWISLNIKPTYQLIQECSDYLKLLKILAAPSLSTCTPERTFSSMKRLKTYLRNSTGQERLNGLALMSIHRRIEVIDLFAAKKARRLNLNL